MRRFTVIFAILAMLLVSITGVNGQSASNFLFSLNKPADWNSMASQIQLDMEAQLTQTVSEFSSTVSIILTGDGQLEKFINPRFPADNNYELNDASKWSFVDSVFMSAAKDSAVYRFKATAENQDNPDVFFQATDRKVLWENFIKLSVMPTNGKLIFTFSDIKVRTSKSASPIALANMAYEINFGTISYFDTVDIDMKFDSSCFYDSPDWKTGRVMLLLGGAGTTNMEYVVNTPSNINLTYNEEAFLVLLDSANGRKRWQLTSVLPTFNVYGYGLMGGIDFTIDTANKTGDTIFLESLKAVRFNGNPFEKKLTSSLAIKYPAKKIWEDSLDIKLYDQGFDTTAIRQNKSAKLFVGLTSSRAAATADSVKFFLRFDKHYFRLNSTSRPDNFYPNFEIEKISEDDLSVTYAVSLRHSGLISDEWHDVGLIDFDVIDIPNFETTIELSGLEVWRNNQEFGFKSIKSFGFDGKKEAYDKNYFLKGDVNQQFGDNDLTYADLDSLDSYLSRGILDATAYIRWALDMNVDGIVNWLDRNILDSLLRLKYTSVYEIPTQALLAYPIPAYQTVNLQLPQDLIIADIKVVDLSGNLVKVIWRQDNGSITLDLQNYSVGVYNLQIRDIQNRLMQGKFIKN